ncbi:MAG: ribosome-associated translation inhibitor RaiA [Bacteroidota bacterium]
MKLQVHSIHFTADQKLLAFIEQKLSKLDQFYDRIISGEVFLKLDKGEKNKTHSKLLEIKINLPGAVLFVKETGKSFEEAVDLALDILKGQLKKFKEKIIGKAPGLALAVVDTNEDDDFE